MSDWNIADYPLFVGIGKALPGTFVFPAFGSSGYAVQTSKDRAGGITTDMATRCIAADLNYQAHQTQGEYRHACDELDKAALGFVASIPPGGRRAIQAPVLNYADPRRYSSSVWPAPWENWRWILNGPGEFLNSPARRADFSDAQVYTAISWAMTGRGDGGYDPAVNGWADARGGRKSSDLWTTLPMGDFDAYYLRGSDGFKVAIAQNGVIVRVYWFALTRKTHSLRAIALFVAVFAVAGAAAYVATAAAPAGAGATAPAAAGAGSATTAGGTTAGAGGAATAAGSTAAGATGSAAGATSGLTLASATGAVSAATGALGAVGGVVQAVQGAGGASTAKPPTVLQPSAQAGQSMLIPAIAAALALAYTLTN